MFEIFEGRRLFSSSLVNRVLTVTGTTGNHGNGNNGEYIE